MKKLNYALLRLGLFCVYPLPGDGDSMTSPNGCRRRCENGKTNDCSYPTEQLEQALDVDSRNSPESITRSSSIAQRLCANSLRGVFYVVGVGSRQDAAALADAFRSANGLSADAFPRMAFSPRQVFTCPRMAHDPRS